MTEPVHIDPGPAEKQKPRRACQCDRPLVFRDEDLDLICGRCGHEPVDQGGIPPRAPLALVAAASSSTSREPLA